MIPERNPPLPLSFRAELLERIMPRLRAGECCSLVGTSGVGKSNLVRFLRRRDVQLAYWGDERTWIVLIDSHSLVFHKQPDEYVVAELMIHRLIMEAESRTLPPEFMAYATDLHTRLIAQPSAHLALRSLERLCARLCEEFELQVIFVFDQFEDVWRGGMDARFFLNLRNLRDQFKYQLAYLVMTRERLERTRQDTQAVEAFWELFASHVYGLGMYSQSDALTMVERIAQRQGVAVDGAAREVILAMSGRHPALLRAVFWAHYHAPDTLSSAVSLLALSPVAAECAKIWNDLMPDEQEMIRLIAMQRPLPNSDVETLAELRLKEIVVGEPAALFSPLFTAYILQQSGNVPTGIVIDLRLRQVWRDGQLLESPLSPLEFSLLAHLAQNVGKVCLRVELLQALYPKEEVHDVSDQRLDTVLRRLREALNEDARNPHYLVTHRGVGVQLVQGNVRE